MPGATNTGGRAWRPGSAESRATTCDGGSIASGGCCRSPTSSGGRSKHRRYSPCARASPSIEANIVKGAPYFAEVVIESTQQLADGNRIVNRTTDRVYRDSEGRTRREEDRAPGQVGSISITTPDPAELELRRRLEAEIAAGMARTTAPTPLPPPPPPAPAPTVAGTMVRPRAPIWDEKTEKLAARQMEGVMAEGTRTTRTIPAGAIGNEQPLVITSEEWYSPELQVLVMTRTFDPRTGESSYRLENISRSEPNQTWFEIPADYTVQSSGVNRLEPTARR